MCVFVCVYVFMHACEFVCVCVWEGVTPNIHTYSGGGAYPRMRMDTHHGILCIYVCMCVPAYLRVRHGNPPSSRLEPCQSGSLPGLSRNGASQTLLRSKVLVAQSRLAKSLAASVSEPGRWLSEHMARHSARVDGRTRIFPIPTVTVALRKCRLRVPYDTCARARRALGWS